MPTPVDRELVFNHAAAEAAADACDAMAAKLRHATAERTSRAGTARHQWSGRHRERFDATSRALDSDSTRISVHLVATAAAIRGAAQEARAEQRAREAERPLS